MELPHQSFWIKPSPDMPAILKKRCLQALQKLHDHGVCHGKIDLSQILIGGDGSIFFIDFHSSRALEPDLKVYLEGATHGDLRLEIRKL
jgi:serine/threonine protein kinase